MSFVTEESGGVDETPPDAADTVFTIVLSVIISGLIVCIGYWLVRS